MSRPLRIEYPGALYHVTTRGNNGQIVFNPFEAETLVIQHEFMHLSFFRDDFKEFVDTLVVALRLIEKVESPIRRIHPVAVRGGDLSDEGRRDFGQGFPVCEDEVEVEASPLPTVLVLTEVGDRL